MEFYKKSFRKKKSVVSDPNILVKCWNSLLSTPPFSSAALDKGKKLSESHFKFYSLRKGELNASFNDNSLCSVKIQIPLMTDAEIKHFLSLCTCKPGFLPDLFTFRVPQELLAMMSDRNSFVLPDFKKTASFCTCGDKSHFCCHIAAVFYTAGTGMEDHPELLLTLRGLSMYEIIKSASKTEQSQFSDNSFDDKTLNKLFNLSL